MPPESESVQVHRVHARGELRIRPLSGVPTVKPGDDIARLIIEALERDEIALRDQDVIAIASKVLSRSEGRFTDLTQVSVSREAEDLALSCDKDPRLVEMILRDAASISRVANGVLITRHRLGFVSANSAIDASNARPEDEGRGEWILTMPEDPDASARAISDRLKEALGARVAIVVTDSHGRPFRVGTVGAAIGVAGLSPVSDECGRSDRHGRVLEHTSVAVADAVAAAADLVLGQADEATPFVWMRGLRYSYRDDASSAGLHRPSEQDLYA